MRSGFRTIGALGGEKRAASRFEWLRGGPLTWPAFLFIGLVLLPGRFEWSETASTGPSWRGLLCSAFFLAIAVPVLSAILRRLFRSQAVYAGLLGIATLTLSLPYRWLGLHHWFYHPGEIAWMDWKLARRPVLTWFPAAFWDPPQIPGELIFFPLVAALLVLGWWIYVRARARSIQPLAASTGMIGTILIVLVVAQTWMHISLRSPYTYLCHFERPASANYWYHVYLFPAGKGAVNADYFVFRALEDVFWGTQGPLNGMLIRRAFPFYLSSQFSRFTNPYYVMLVMNILLWIGASWAILDYVSGHFGRRAAIAAALLTATAPGFIMYAAQPQSYLWGYGFAAIVVWAHWRLCMQPGARFSDYMLFSGILSIALLTYDLVLLLAYLVGYHLLFKRPLLRLVCSIGLALGVYAVFGLLAGRMSGIVPDVSNSKYIGVSLHNAAAAVFSSPVSWKTFALYSGLLPNYVWNLGNTVFVFPLVFAVAGLFLVDQPRNLKLLGILALPSLLSFAVLYLGQTELATFPRFVFVGYPAVYAACGVVLAKLLERAAPHGRFVAGMVWVVGIGFHMVLTNSDVFGHPWLYYLFYYQRAGVNAF